MTDDPRHAFTAGPWSKSGSGYVFSQEDGSWIASYSHPANNRNNLECRSNGYLIAAAPDLYLALHNLVENVTFYEENGIADQKDFEADRENAIMTALAALREAVPNDR